MSLPCIHKKNKSVSSFPCLQAYYTRRIDVESYLTRDELGKMHFKKVGEDVKISRRAVFYSPERIEVGEHVRIDDFVFVSGGSGISIGDYVHIAAYSALYGKFGIEIEDYVNISSRVSVYSTSDDYSGNYLCGPLVDQRYIHDIGQKVLIEKYVIIGTGCVLLPGAVVRQGAAIGAMSLIKQEISPFGIYAGVPARYIKDRSKEVLNKLYINTEGNETNEPDLLHYYKQEGDDD